MATTIGNKLPGVTSSNAPAQIDPKTLTSGGQQLKAAAEAAAKLPMGPERAKAFSDTVLPLLLKDAIKIIGGDEKKLAAVLAPAVSGAGESQPSLGLKSGEKGLAADTDYPPRAANAVWNDFAAALGISKADAAAVTELNTQIGSYPKADGKYAPAFEALSPELQALSTKVAKSLLGEDVGPLTSKEQAFKANLVLNNLTWHTTNFERASGDASRADPLARNNVFNTYSDNLAYASQRGGLPAVIDMAISDSYNAGKPGVGKAALAQPTQITGYGAAKRADASEVKSLSGEMSGGAQVAVPQRDVFGTAPSRKDLEAKLRNLEDQAGVLVTYFKQTGDPRDFGRAGVEEWTRSEVEYNAIQAQIAGLKGELEGLK